MTEQIKITAPLTDSDVEKLRVGDKVLVSGVIYTARDSAHKKMLELIDQGKANELPFDLKGQVIYYVGPTPAKPGAVIGSAGPTTAGRMDAFTPKLLELGIKATIGKGGRTPEVVEAMQKYKAVYLAAVGGAAALIARSIKKVEVIAYPELGPEAVRRMEVEDFPAIVVNDIFGGDLFTEGVEKYKRT